MLKNMASWDRILRAIVAVVLGYIVFTGMVTGFWAVLLGIVGVVLLLTAVVGYCPLYHLLKISTGGKTA